MAGRWRLALAVGMATTLAVSACGQQPPSGAATQAPGTGAATVRGAGGELRLVWWQGPTILNPHLSQGTKD
jgi:ABC-type transport system substrate-binding protein